MIEKTIAEYNRLVARACEIAEKLPPFTGADPELAKLEIAGEVATLYWPEWAGGYYAGEGNIERQSYSFSSALLVEGPEADAYVVAKNAEYEEAQRLRTENEKRNRELAERRTLDLLLARYGVSRHGGPCD